MTTRISRSTAQAATCRPTASTRLAEDALGAIWAGTFGGVVRFADGIWSTPILSSSLPSLVITDFYADDAGLWIGTEEGLAYYDLASGDLTTIPELAGHVVEVLAPDGEERLWVGTADDGIWVLADDGWQHMEVDPRTRRQATGRTRRHGRPGTRTWNRAGRCGPTSTVWGWSIGMGSMGSGAQ